jgi:hypothetical protein
MTFGQRFLMAKALPLCFDGISGAAGAFRQQSQLLRAEALPCPR